MATPTRDIVVIGGSAGGLEAAGIILASLPADLPAAVLVALHRSATTGDPERLVRVLGRDSTLPVVSAQEELAIEFGRVHVATADHHLLLENGILRVQDSPRESHFRPSVDVLFKSAAATYGRRVIGVVLSGILGGDGPAGLWHIRDRGGVAIVQDPSDARYPAMPRAVISHVDVDHVLPTALIGPKLVELVSQDPLEKPAAATRVLIVEDESVVATNLQYTLTEMGYEVLDWVPTGEAAIDLAEREHPDLILMDIHLAGALSGIDTARRIWQRLQIPIVFCTAHAEMETLRAVQTTESYGYVVKPFQASAVRAAVELALARRERELR